MSKTIKQIADSIGVSKTAVRKKMDDDFRAKYVETGANGTILVSDEGANLLVESFRKPAETTENKLSETNENQVSADREAWYQQQIDEKDKQIAKLQTALDQAQRLQLIAEQKVLQLESPKKRWQFWK